MGWAQRLIEYAAVVLVAIIVSMLLIYFLFPKPGPCTDCVVSMPQARAECDKQFFSSATRARQLDAKAEAEFLVAYAEKPDESGVSGGGGFSQPPTTSTVRPRGPGYVMVRAQPQFGYDYSGSQTSSYGAIDTNTPPETVWNDVVVTVARYVNHVRNDAVAGCDLNSVRFREGRFEAYCEMVHRFGDDDGGQVSYRIFVRNDSNAPVEYCIVTNCDASAPYGFGTLCQAEQPPAQ